RMEHRLVRLSGRSVGDVVDTRPSRDGHRDHRPRRHRELQRGRLHRAGPTMGVRVPGLPDPRQGGSMQHYICWTAGLIAVVIALISVVLVYLGAVNQPGNVVTLTLVVGGLSLFCIAAAFGAVSAVTYMTPYERAQWRTAQRLSKRLK